MLVEVADPRESVLVPTVSARSGVLMREVIPCGAVRAVILSHRAPGALAQVGTDRFPVTGMIDRSLGEPSVLGGSRPDWRTRLIHRRRPHLCESVCNDEGNP